MFLFLFFILIPLDILFNKRGFIIINSLLQLCFLLFLLYLGIQVHFGLYLFLLKHLLLHVILHLQLLVALLVVGLVLDIVLTETTITINVKVVLDQCLLLVISLSSIITLMSLCNKQLPHQIITLYFELLSFHFLKLCKFLESSILFKLTLTNLLLFLNFGLLQFSFFLSLLSHFFFHALSLGLFYLDFLSFTLMNFPELLLSKSLFLSNLVLVLFQYLLFFGFFDFCVLLYLFHILKFFNSFLLFDFPLQNQLLLQLFLHFSLVFFGPLPRLLLLKLERLHIVLNNAVPVVIILF